MKQALAFAVTAAFVVVRSSAHASVGARELESLTADQDARSFQAKAALSSETSTADGSFLTRVESAVDEELAGESPMRRTLALLAQEVGFPLPTVDHEKSRGSGYKPGSPLFNEQEAWKAQNGNNVYTGGGADPWLVSPWLVSPSGALQALRSAAAGILLAAFFNILILVVSCCLYPRWAADWRKSRFLEQAPAQADFLHAIYDLDCFSDDVTRRQHDAEICMCCLFCGLCQWADNMSSYKMFPGSYWYFLLGMLALALVITPLSAVFPLFGLVPVCVIVYFRQQMRKKFHGSNTSGHCLFDCACVIFCPCLVAFQSAREVEKVDPFLGQPVRVEQRW